MQESGIWIPLEENRYFFDCLLWLSQLIHPYMSHPRPVQKQYCDCLQNKLEAFTKLFKALDGEWPPAYPIISFDSDFIFLSSLSSSPGI
jgi:hypothetical protein